MEIPLLSQLFGGKNSPDSDDERIVLADFDLHPSRTIDMPPIPAKPPVAAAGPEPSRTAYPDELTMVVGKLACGMTTVWTGAVQEMQGILAADHAKMEAAASEMCRVTDQLRSVTEELTAVRRRLLALEESVQELCEARQSLESRVGLLSAEPTKRAGDVLAAIRKLKDALGPSAPRVSLPENL